ncbi:MAG: hypothetical protein R2733_26075 [Acidimicrobiales bacterium]
MFRVLRRAIPTLVSRVRRVVADDGSGGRIDRAHGDNLGRAPHGSGQM